MTALRSQQPLPALAAGEERKRLGQFFTGTPVGRLLAALADAHHCKQIIDPMAGSGDLLAACLDVGATPSRLAAIDIDSRALAWADDRLTRVGPAFASVVSSAFVPDAWDRLGAGWDLVITNPPYLRYQLNTAHGQLPDARQIRAGLIDCIRSASHLGDEERAAFLRAACTYSGLSDLAVPCWILCMSRVAVGGRVAMLVPNTWMSRQYAAPVADLLRRYFTVEAVVEDGDACWFDDALVRTTLVVARRVSAAAVETAPAEHWQVRLHKEATDSEGVVSAALGHRHGARTKQPERAFVRLLRAGRAGDLPGVQVIKARDDRLTGPLTVVSALSPAEPPLPYPLSAVSLAGGVTDLQALGWSVGQGLRSGANDFFYVIRSGEHFLSALLPGELLDLPPQALRPLVFRQAELGDRRTVLAHEATSYVLVLNRFVHPADALNNDIRAVMAGDLLRLVETAAKTTYDRSGTPKPLPQLSAVAPNVRAQGPEGLPTHWYHLPRLTDRHTPSLLVARVNGRTPRAVLNAGRLTVVDANFTSLWPQASPALTPQALFAVMNSGWAACWLESSCTVMGGGALKVEAADLRRMPLPRPDRAAAKRLHHIGAKVLSGLLDAAEASRTVASVLGYPNDEQALQAAASAKRLQRNPR